jgi:hypothetical protein
MANGLFVPLPPPPPGINFPFSIASDMLSIMGLPGSYGSPLTYATVVQTDPDTGAAVATATNVTILKRNTGVVSQDVGEGQIAWVDCSKIRIWASTCAFVPKYLDKLTDAEGMVWIIGKQVSMESFNGFYTFEKCVQLKT